jgi:hypothetical protein
LFAELEKEDRELVEMIKTMNCHQITKPETDEAFKKFVQSSVSAACENKKYSVGVKKEQVNTDGWQFYLDNRNYRIIVNMHFGSRIKDDSSDSE